MLLLLIISAKGDDMRILLCSFFAALLFTALNASAEETPPLSEKEGKWTFSMSDSGADLKSVSKDKQKKIRGSLQDIARIVTSTPAMSPPKGFEARFWGSVSARDRYDACTGKKCPPSRPATVLAMMLGRYEESNGKVRAAFNTPSTMDISTNNLGHIFAQLPVLYKDAEGYLLPEPQVDGERAGMRTYSNKGHAIAVITRNDKPLWLPVSRERYLKAAIAAASQGAGQAPEPARKGRKKMVEENVPAGKPMLIEEVRTWIDPAEEKKWLESSRSLAFDLKEPVEVVNERFQKLQAELEAMPSEQRTLQARVDIATADDGQPSLLPFDSNSGVAVVTPDFRYFNPKLPAEAIQLIVVQWKFDGNLTFDPQKSGITETLNNLKLLEIYKTMDWEKLRAKVTRTAP
jgi:hypothetical protein